MAVAKHTFLHTSKTCRKTCVGYTHDPEIDINNVCNQVCTTLYTNNVCKNTFVYKDTHIIETQGGE